RMKMNEAEKETRLGQSCDSLVLLLKLSFFLYNSYIYLSATGRSCRANTVSLHLSSRNSVQQYVDSSIQTHNGCIFPTCPVWTTDFAIPRTLFTDQGYHRVNHLSQSSDLLGKSNIVCDNLDGPVAQVAVCLSRAAEILGSPAQTKNC